eukprot:6866565-Alexandrium_andersonii.AAC.1
MSSSRSCPASAWRHALSSASECTRSGTLVCAGNGRREDRMKRSILFRTFVRALGARNLACIHSSAT